MPPGPSTPRDHMAGTAFHLLGHPSRATNSQTQPGWGPAFRPPPPDSAEMGHLC